VLILIYDTKINKNIVKVKVDVSRLDTNKRKTKAKNAAIRMQTVLNSNDFKIRLLTELSENMNGELSKWKYAKPVEIYNRIISGAVSLDENKDGVIDIQMDDYYSFKKVIGYTKKNIQTIFVNTKYFDRRSHKQIGSNLTHEYGHKCGFSHHFRNTSVRNRSICYILNDVFESAYDAIFVETPKEAVYYVPWYVKLWRRVRFW